MLGALVASTMMTSFPGVHAGPVGPGWVAAVQGSGEESADEVLVGAHVWAVHVNVWPWALGPGCGPWQEEAQSPGGTACHWRAHQACVSEGPKAGAQYQGRTSRLHAERFQKRFVGRQDDGS